MSIPDQAHRNPPLPAAGVPHGGRLLFGGDYNPEQWPRQVWREDVALMKRAGVTTVTVGVFSWALLEPVEGTFEADWLDEVLELLHAAGIGVMLATPTASPPPWFSAYHPEALPEGPDGVRRWHGSRDTYCLSAPSYRAAARRIARLLAQRYAAHPAVVGWHVHNEYGTPCWCDHVATAFRRWLQQRYGSLETLNEAWGTSFWSQHYSSWSDVLPPRATQYLHNPCQSVDFRRFTSDELLACFTEQREEIAAAGSPAPVTTNFMLPTWNHLEQWSWAAQEDFVSLDHYLDTTGPDGEAHVAYAADLARSWAGGRPWLLMEQSTGITAGGRSTPKTADRILRNSLSYIARGSQGALFFQWRASTAGSETWHGALVPHTGADSATFRAAEQLGEVLRHIAQVSAPPEDGRVVEADVAVLWHADGWWALENAGLPSPDLTYSDALRGTHRALHHLGLAVDFLAPGVDLGTYRMVIVPSMYGLDDAAVATLERYVRDQGGHLVVGCFTGVADETMRVVPGGYPGRLRDLLGVRVEAVQPLAPGEHLPLSDGSTAVLWSELVHLAGAEATVTYTTGSLEGLPAVTRLHHPAKGGARQGVATYLSTRLSDADLADLLARTSAGAGVRPILDVPPPPGIEVVRRRGVDHDHLFILNHGRRHHVVHGTGLDLVAGTPIDGGLILPGGHLVVRLPRSAPNPLTGWHFTERSREDDGERPPQR